MDEAVRKGARSRAEIDPGILEELNAGRIAAATLAECLAVDHAALLRAVLPDLPADAVAELGSHAGSGITRRMAAAAGVLLAHLGEGGIAMLAAHPSDTVRGWAAFMIGVLPDVVVADRLERIRAFADDRHFGVREWAWLALRRRIADDIERSIRELQPWTGDPSANIRRFAIEATRPRGVWAAHIDALKRDPDLGLCLLEPLKADPAIYVQDSVANWINDASKDLPAWASSLCTRWRSESLLPATARICDRATRSLRSRTVAS
jgi:3-methyladenine DNA glycosylase AlkC